MFALIKREIRDHVGFFIAMIIISAILVGILVSVTLEYQSIDRAIPRMGALLAAVMIASFLFFSMGAVQMYIDKTRRISAFISTLPVSRSRILLAKLVAGVLAILTLLVPLAIAVAILFRLFSPPIPVFAGVLFDTFAGSFLTAFACYCIGLQAGFKSGKAGPALAGLALTAILISLVIVKGLGSPIVLVVVPFIIASLVRVWHTFTSTSL
ncbi:MAG: hypothetical protein P8Z79_18025 [Sedimentisphaerales bacterium]